MSQELREFESEPYSLFLFAINSPLTKQKYVPRLSKFFNFINLKGSIQDRCKTFSLKSKDEPPWALGWVIKFLQMNKERVQRKEITAATPLNYVKTIKLFCEMNDILLPWKGITSGLPKARRYADDRAPTIEEVRKIIEYPDRRIKAIVLTMVSSGIRLGAWDYLKWKHIIPIEREGKITAAKIVVYKGDPEEYISFTTPENQKAPIPHTILSISITDRIHKESRFIKRGLCEAVNFRERQSLEKWDWGKFV